MPLIEAEDKDITCSDPRDAFMASISDDMITGPPYHHHQFMEVMPVHVDLADPVVVAYVERHIVMGEYRAR
jgi:hypothetical protein